MMEKGNWYVMVDSAAADVKEPEFWLDSEINETWGMDKRPYSPYTFDSEQEAWEYYYSEKSYFDLLASLKDIREEINQAWLDGDNYKTEQLIAEERELESQLREGF